MERLAAEVVPHIAGADNQPSVATLNGRDEGGRFDSATGHRAESRESRSAPIALVCDPACLHVGDPIELTGAKGPRR